MSKSDERRSVYQYPRIKEERNGSISADYNLAVGPDYTNNELTSQSTYIEPSSLISEMNRVLDNKNVYTEVVNGIDNRFVKVVSIYEKEPRKMIPTYKSNLIMEIEILKEEYNNSNDPEFSKLVEKIEKNKESKCSVKKINFKRIAAITAASVGIVISANGFSKVLDKQFAVENQNAMDYYKEVNEAEGYNKIDIPGTVEEEVNAPIYSEEEKQTLREDLTTMSPEEQLLEQKKQLEQAKQELTNNDEEMDFFGFDEPSKSR